MNQRAQNTEIPAVILFGKDETSKPHASFFNEVDLAGALNAAALMKMQVLRTDSKERRAIAAELPQGRVFASGKAFVPFVAAPVYQRLVGLAAAADSICADERGWGRPGEINESVTAPESNRAPFGDIEGSPPRAQIALAAAAYSNCAGDGQGPGSPETQSAATPELQRPISGGLVGAGVVLAASGRAYTPVADQPKDRDNASDLTPRAVVLASVGSDEGWWESVILEINEDLITLKWEEWPDEPAFVRHITQIAVMHPSHTPGY
jgi:hypothetical protein